ncbi:MAG: hypothetical protein ACI9J3_002090 [Parvicellaceae bacterium]|jgi:hypothetical protein
MRKIGFILIMLMGISYAQSTFPADYKWKTKIGLTCYRTNMLFHDGKIIIGSNGDDRNSDNDDAAGVYFIDPTNGKINHQIKGLSLGDNDVNGLAIANNTLYYGSDLNYVYAYDLNLKEEKWKYQLPNNLESVPGIANLNGDSIMDIVFNCQGSGVYAFDGAKGDTLWHSKVYTHGGNSSPAIYDLNNDGIDDLVCGGYAQWALNGKDGSELWFQKKNSGVHGSPLILEFNDSVRIHTVASYGDYDIFDLKGNRLGGVGAGYGLFASPVPSGKSLYSCVSNSWGSSSGVSSFSIDFNDWVYEEGKKRMGPGETIQYKGFGKSKACASAVSLDLDGDGNVEFLIPDEKGTLFIIHPEKEEAEEISMPAGSEATLFVGDFDGDGIISALYSGLDGFLYCYDLPKAKNIVWNSFRGPNNNGTIKMGF